MMAAATPRLRPLLRALRAQRFRGPVWCCGAPAVRGVASDAGQARLEPESCCCPWCCGVSARPPGSPSTSRSSSACPSAWPRPGGGRTTTRLGAETGVSAPGAGAVRQILRLLPLFFLPFIIHFPTAIFTYWLTSNSFSLLQTGLLRIPALRAKLGVAPPPAPPPATPTGPAPKGKGGILQQLKKEWREAQATHEAEQRQWRLRNHLHLAAKGPLRQTFAQNPLSPPKTAPSEPPKRPWKDTLG
ncbi:mitochondrial inner membrane protein OXA1L [Motacilla alba alba]|uniref:mitochondrial inner membrane protein OXA1L n=1 Tax=Motacilla alba alba TaxID=1094192 RepID=UPI0018D564C1|nr:mitochondrial inner membrane protein OXA1L [Motacilla alba alba]